MQATPREIQQNAACPQHAGVCPQILESGLAVPPSAHPNLEYENGRRRVRRLEVPHRRCAMAGVSFSMLSLG